MICFRHKSQPFGNDEYCTAKYDFDNCLFFAQLGEDTAGFFTFLQLRCQRRLAFSLQQYNTLFYLIGYSLHFLQQTIIIFCTYAQLFRSKGQGSFINLRHSVQRAFNLGTAVSTVQILHQVYSALAAQLRTTVTRYYHYVGFDRCTDFLNFRQQSLMVCSAEAQLLGSKAYVSIGYARQLFNFIFHFGSAVGTAKVLQNIYTLNFIGIRHTAGAISQALAAYIAVLLMRMADFAITVSRMTRNVMSVYMSMFVAMVVTATAFVTMCVSVFVLMTVVVTATAFVTMCVSMFFVLVIMSATACVTMCVSVFFVLVSMSATALVAVCMGMFVSMLVPMVMSATACVAVRVCVLVLVAVVMSAAALVAVCVFMLVLMVVAAATFVAVRVSVLVLVVMSAATFVAVCVSVFFIFMLMIIATAAVIAMLMGMLFMVMIVIVSAAASIAMSMLRHMSHSFMIMVLAAVTAGAAFRMLAVILYTIDMAVDVTKCSYIACTVTDIFQIFLHYISHLSFQVISLFI